MNDNMRSSVKRLMLFIADEMKKMSVTEQREVWSILTALRGPDDENGSDKAGSTEVIRATVFGDDFTENFGAYSGLDTPHKLDLRKQMCIRRPAYDHFLLHAQRAFVALGLEWFNVNPEV